MEITCIIPVYNVQQYLKKCLDSVLNQSFTDYEIILIDDGSTDESGKLCDDYAKKHFQIKVIHQKNGGLSVARNRGIVEAKGKYVIFIDSDDYIDKDMFATLYSMNINLGSDIAACDKAIVYENSMKIEYGSENGKISVFNPEEAFVKAVDFYGKFGMEIWNKLYKRELFNVVRFPAGKLFEDQATQYKLFFAANKISYIQKSLYYYLRRNNSITTQSYSDKEKQRLEMVNLMVDYIKENHKAIVSQVIKYKLLSCNLTIANKMIKAGIYDYDFLKEVSTDTKKELKILQKGSLSITRKLQFLLFIHMWPVYKILYKILFGNKVY